MSSQPQVDNVAPHRIPMDPELLKKARRGDRSLVEDLRGITGITIAVHNGDAHSAQDRAPNGNAPPPQEQRVSILLGVTIGGNTILHIAATHGHLELAEIICQRERSLLDARNVMRETPLHCAARAGHHQIVKFIISFTRNSNQFEVVLRARNRDWGNALHEAVRNGHVEVANQLMTADPGLANMVDQEGISPLYLAAMAGSLPLIRAIIPLSSTTTTAAAAPFRVSYAGPNGQTALHAVAFRHNSEIAKELLKWDQELAKIADDAGSTPLHYAASAGNDEIAKLLLQKDSSLSYIADSSGIFPVHVAATRGFVSVIKQHTEHCPDSDELLDIKGSNFLHTAVENKRVAIVQYVCKSSRLAKLMNASDFEGNTPLHLAVKKGDQRIVGLLMRDKRVNLSIMNNEGQTPLDLSIIGLESGLTYGLNPSYWILRCLLYTGALGSPRRLDHFLREKRARMDLKKESEKYLHLNQSLAISSVVIATVTFAAAFTLPGGYRSDGTPTLAGKYLFKAFVIADTLAFILSVLSTCWNSYGGSVLLHPSFRGNSIVFSSDLLLLATRCMVVAFALAIYLVLSTISKSIGIVVFVTAFTSFFIITPNMRQIFGLAITIKSRVGWTDLFKSSELRRIEKNIPLWILWSSWIYIFIFLLALLK